MKKHSTKLTANRQTIILKLGGSVLTEKMSGKPQLKKAVVRQLAKELKQFVKYSPQTKIILLHGAGSFGHPLVYRYKLLEQPLTAPKLLGCVKTICSMRHMGNLLINYFQFANLPVLPIQTSAVLTEKNNTMALSNLRQLWQMLNTGFIPMLGGDVGFTEKKQAVVISADKLAVMLAKAFPNSKIIFATDVDGVFEKFPPPNNAQPFSVLYSKKIKNILKKMNEQKNGYDTTGSMAGKLRALLSLRKKEVIIFNGLKQGNLTKALTGQQVGTRLIF